MKSLTMGNTIARDFSPAAAKVASNVKMGCGLKARSATSATREEDLSICEEAPVTREPLTCWGGWLLDFAKPVESRPRLLTIWASDHEEDSSSSVSSIATLEEVTEEDIIHRLMHEGDSLERQGKLFDALVIYQRALELQRTARLDHLGEIHFRAGVVQWMRGAYKESLSHFDQAFFAYQLHCDTTSDEDFCEVLLATGRVHLSTGDRSLAKKCFHHSLSYLQTDGDVSSIPDRAKHLYAKAMHSLGMVYEASGNLDKASQNYEVALSMQRLAAVNEHTDTAATLLSFGSLHEKKGEYDLALNYFTEAYDIYSRLVSSQSSLVDMGVALTSIGWIHFLNKNLQEAQAAYNDALTLVQPLGEHRNVAAVMVQMGMVHVAQGMDAQAAKIYAEALRIQLAVLGNYHEDVATTLIALGSTMKRQGCLHKAVECLDRAIKIRRSVFGSQNLHLGVTLVQLGGLHVRGGHTDSAR